MISPEVISSLNQSIVGESGGGEDVEFALTHLKKPELDMRNAVEVRGKDEEDLVEVEGEDEEDLLMISFTDEEDQDQLY